MHVRGPAHKRFAMGHAPPPPKEHHLRSNYHGAVAITITLHIKRKASSKSICGSAMCTGCWQNYPTHHSLPRPVFSLFAQGPEIRILGSSGLIICTAKLGHNVTHMLSVHVCVCMCVKSNATRKEQKIHGVGKTSPTLSRVCVCVGVGVCVCVCVCVCVRAMCHVPCSFVGSKKHTRPRLQTRPLPPFLRPMFNVHGARPP